MGITDDLWLQTLSFLEALDVLQVSSCNKKYNQISQSAWLWEGMIQRDFKGTTFPICFEGSAKGRYASLQKLDQMAIVRWRRDVPRGWHLPVRREGHAATEVGGRIVVFAGFCQDQEVRTLDPEDEKGWEAVDCTGQSPRGLYGHSFVTVTTKERCIAMYGGLSQGGYVGETNDLHILTFDASFRKGVWNRVDGTGCAAPLLGFHTAAFDEDQNKMWIFGGINESSPQNGLYSYQFHDNIWASYSSLEGRSPDPRFGCSSTVYKGGLYICGGYTGSGMFACMDGDDLRDVWRYDMQAEVWREVSTYSRPEPALGRCHGMCLLGRKMVFFGGTCDASNRVTMLDLHTNKWHSPKVLGRTIGRKMRRKTSRNRMSPSGLCESTD
jgi:hypothetical protein